MFDLLLIFLTAIALSACLALALVHGRKFQEASRNRRMREHLSWTGKQHRPRVAAARSFSR